MRRASVLVAVTAVSLILVGACTSFPELTVDEAAGDSDAASSGGDDSGDVTSGGDADVGSPAKQDAAAGTKDASAVPDAAGTKDAAPDLDAAMMPDTAPPPPCAAASLDCSVPANKMCKPCMEECAAGCAGLFGACCAIENGNSGTYKACCYYVGGSCSKSCN